MRPPCRWERTIACRRCAAALPNGRDRATGTPERAPTDTSDGGRSSGPIRRCDALGAVLACGRPCALDNLTVWTACEEAANGVTDRAAALSLNVAVDLPTAGAERACVNDRLG